MRVFGKSLRDNAPPTILSNTPSCSSNITDATLCHPRHPPQHTAQFIHISEPPTSPTLARNPHQPVTHAGMSSTLARHQRKHPPPPPEKKKNLAGLSRKHNIYVTHISTNSMTFLRLLGNQLSFTSFQISNSKRKFSSFYFQLLLLKHLLFRPS